MSMHGRARRQTESGGIGRTDFWAPIACLLAGIVAVGTLVAALPHAPAEPTHDTRQLQSIRQQLAAPAELVGQWRAALASLCQDAILQAEGLAADCLTGAIRFGDELFDAEDTVQLGEEGIRKLHLAIVRLLASLRAHPVVWQNLESIELRGHADPRARRDPYVTNMRISQQRPMSIMLYLISDWGLSEQDRSDLQHLLVLSAASYSRPPKSCPDRSRECYPHWRRVEIIPRLRTTALQTGIGAIRDVIGEQSATPQPIRRSGG